MLVLSSGGDFCCLGSSGPIMPKRTAQKITETLAEDTSSSDETFEGEQHNEAAETTPVSKKPRTRSQTSQDELVELPEGGENDEPSEHSDADTSADEEQVGKDVASSTAATTSTDEGSTTSDQDTTAVTEQDSKATNNAVVDKPSVETSQTSATTNELVGSTENHTESGTEVEVSAS